MALKLLYHEDALSDLEEVFEWSRERHPERRASGGRGSPPKLSAEGYLLRAARLLGSHPQESEAPLRWLHALFDKSAVQAVQVL